MKKKGIDPGNFRMQNGHSTTWANSPNIAHSDDRESNLQHARPPTFPE